MAPPERALVLCVDEKSQIQALDRSQPLLAMRPGQAERRTHDDKRHGTLSLFAALDCASGKVIGRCFKRHRAKASSSRAFSTPLRTTCRRISTSTSSWTTSPRTRRPPSRPGSPEAQVVRPLHADQRIVDQSGRALLRRVDAEADPARRTSLDRRTRRGDQEIHRSCQSKPEAIAMDEVRRRHPRLHKASLHGDTRNRSNPSFNQRNFGIGTLGAWFSAIEGNIVS